MPRTGHLSYLQRTATKTYTRDQLPGTGPVWETCYAPPQNTKRNTLNQQRGTGPVWNTYGGTCTPTYLLRAPHSSAIQPSMRRASTIGEMRTHTFRKCTPRTRPPRPSNEYIPGIGRHAYKLPAYSHPSLVPSLDNIPSIMDTPDAPHTAAAHTHRTCDQSTLNRTGHIQQ